MPKTPNPGPVDNPGETSIISRASGGDSAEVVDLTQGSLSRADDEAVTHDLPQPAAIDGEAPELAGVQLLAPLEPPAGASVRSIEDLIGAFDGSAGESVDEVVYEQ